VTEILEIDAKTNELLTNDVFRWEPANDAFVYLGRSFVLEHIGELTGRSVESLALELRRKEQYLRLMDRSNQTYFKDVSRAIAAYYIDPVEAIRSLELRVGR